MVGVATHSILAPITFDGLSNLCEAHSLWLVNAVGFWMMDSFKQSWRMLVGWFQFILCQQLRISWQECTKKQSSGKSNDHLVITWLCAVTALIYNLTLRALGQFQTPLSCCLTFYRLYGVRYLFHNWINLGGKYAASHGYWTGYCGSGLEMIVLTAPTNKLSSSP